MKKNLLFTLTILTLTASCSGSKDEKLQKNLKPVWNEYFEQNFNDTAAVNIFVVTNRKAKNNLFGCNNDTLGTTVDSNLKFGICGVNVPKNHSIGDIVLAKDAQQSSQNYFKILNAQPLSEEDLIEMIKKTNRTPLVFIHGFNVRYQEAILRAAQIAYDLKYQGPVILFTWPAGASEGFFDDALLNKTYENNLTAARASIPFFKNFLLDLAKNNLKINLMVHSMGHQTALPALRQLSVEKQKTVISELILNAPDFDAKEFSTFVNNIISISNRVTLYCSSNDKAMLASKTFNDGERLGACRSFSNVDSINVSLIDSSALSLGHGYYSSRAILNDLFQVLLGIDAEKRLFIKKSEPNSSEKYFLRQ
jgi:esterase/lipase superfamily enzyme